VSGLSDDERSIALGLAQHSRHPLSRGLADALRAEGVEPAAVSDVVEESGTGLSGRHDSIDVALDRPEATDESSPDELMTRLRIGERAHILSFGDPLRPDVPDTIARLDAKGLSASILSGDRTAAVEAIANRLGIAARGGISPQGKLAALEELRAEGRKPLMVGDGLNDGPALAAAHASIAPGSASDASQQAADAVFIGERLMPVALAIRVARATMGIVRQNFGFAIVYNVLAVPLALFGYVTPLIAAIAMSLSSLVVVANSLRLAGSATDRAPS
jgi:Cu2+-exporting ATPase